MSEIETLYPISDGYYKQLTPYPSGSSHYIGVEESGDGKDNRTMAGDFLYDTFFFSAPTLNGVISNVQLSIEVNTSGGLAGNSHRIRLDGQDFTYANTPRTDNWDNNPKTGLPWTKEQISAPYFQGGAGIRISLGTIMLDQVRVYVTYSEVYPDNTRRISTIRHVYRPGSFRMELGFGGITDEVKTETSKLVIKDEVKDTTQEVTAPTKVVDEMKSALENEGIGAIVDRIKTDKAFLRYGYTTTDIMRWVNEGLTPRQILYLIHSYKGAKVDLEKTDKALENIGLTTGQTMDLIKQGSTPQEILTSSTAEVRRAKAFNKYGYSEAEVRAMVKKGMRPGDIVKYMMAHPK